MKAFEEGRSAFLKGQSGNPYPIDTNKNREWERGWNKEYFLNLEKLGRDNQGEG